MNHGSIGKHWVGRLAGWILLAGSLAATGCRTPEDTFKGLPSLRSGAAYITVFNIGQADAMLVVHRGRSLLIDAGATLSKQARQNFRDIPRRLEALTGRRHLDYLMPSHYHQDHIGVRGRGARAGLGNLGFWGLLDDEGVTVDTMVDRGFMTFGPKGNTQKAYERGVKRWIREGKVKRRVQARPRDLLDLGPGMKVEIITANGIPRLMQIREQNPRLLKNFPPSENDYSIEVKITMGDFEMVTGGDLSGHDVTRAFGPIRMSYNDIESSIAYLIGDVEVYRVHHHGSANSTNECYLKVLHPEVSILSTGMNGYNHPDLGVMARLEKLGQVLITSGADKDVYNQVKAYIQEADVNVVVAPNGKTYWVNHRLHHALSEAQEAARKDRVTGCTPSTRRRDPDVPEETGEIEPD